MTLIVSANGLVMADSLRMAGDEHVFKTGKIFAYAKPLLLRSLRLKMKDWFYGFAGSGDDQVIQQAGWFAGDGSMDAWVDTYKHIDRLRVITDESSFMMMFFGLKGTLTAVVTTGLVQIDYVPYADCWMVATGSGAGAYKRVLTEHKGEICRVRAMYASFAMEPTAGGAVEVWQLPNTRGGTFKSLGTVQSATLPQCFKIAADANTVLENIYSLEECRRWLQVNTQDSPKHSTKQLVANPSTASLRLPGFRTLQWSKLSAENYCSVLKRSTKSQSISVSKPKR